MNLRRPIALVSPLALAACATPADVTADHERAVRGHEDWLRSADATYREDLARAEAWDNHFMSIPASGWVPILIFACVIGALLVGLAGYQTFAALNDRRYKRHELALDHEKTLRAAAERGGCHMCGALPVTVSVEADKVARGGNA